jgi:hypothetical protein
MISCAMRDSVREIASSSRRTRSAPRLVSLKSVA